MEFLRIAEERKLCKDCETANILDVQQFRSTRRSRLIANEVIDETGQFNVNRASQLLSSLEMPIYGPFDELYSAHVKNILNFFLTSKEAKLRLRQLSFPLASPYVDRLIRYSLLIKEGQKLERRSISVALVFSLLAFLRQSVGSCFSTAPLIITQQQNIGFLLQDLYDLLTRGFLRRVIEGDEMKSPISPKTGHGDLLKHIGPEGDLDPALKFLFGREIAKGVSVLELIQSKLPPLEASEAQELFKAHAQPPILKCYEYTVAAFSDWKTDFYKWNMYTGLGLNHEEKGGIGEKLYTALSEKLLKANAELTVLQEEIQRGIDGLRVVETLLKNASSIDQIRRLKNELKYKDHALLLQEESYAEERKKAEKLSQFYKFLIEQFTQFFPFYFQEVYDPEMFEEDAEIFADRPAGFRLLYKHGRIDPTVWTMIYNENDYKSALIDFFNTIEQSITTAWQWQGEKVLVREMIDQVIERMQEPIFLSSAIERTRRMHAERLSEYSTRKPWAYISGGSVESLVKCYYNSAKELTRFDLFPETPLDLCIGLIELMKDLPYTFTKPLENPLKSLLMVNLTHAFVFKPALEPFLSAWHEKGNTFTYVRDEIQSRSLHFYENVRLTAGEIASIGNPIGIDLHASNVKELYREIRENPPLKFPLFEERLMTLLLAKGGLQPLLFADSNWNSDLLGFIVSPESGELEIWRFDGTIARPLYAWKNHFQKKKWSLYQLPNS